MSRKSSPILSLHSQPHLSPGMSARSPKSQKKSMEKDQKTAYFKEVITGAGVILQHSIGAHTITQEQALVVRDISKTLRSHVTHPNNVQEFLTGLKIFLKKADYFQKSLLPTELQKDQDLAGLKMQQDSLLRILLNVGCLQSEIIGILLEEVINCVGEEHDDTTQLRLLLNQLRYLSHINDSKTLTTELLDTLEISSFTAQLEILNMIPEIIPDNEYETTANQLSKLLDGNADLTGAIIDCLNSLTLSTDVRHEIQQQILNKLESTSSSRIFPILFEFLITDCNSKGLQTVLLHARITLDMIMGLKSADEDAESNKVLIFNRLQSLATARKSLYEGWINAISTVRSNVDQKPIDLLILFMLHSLANSRKSVIEGLIRKRIKAGYFKISLLEALFERYFELQILKDFLESITEIATSLLRFYSDPVLIEFASTMYKLLFVHKMVDRIQRQNIIHSLIVLTGMSDKKAVRPVLNVLVSFLEAFEQLQQHTVQLMGLLEKLDVIELQDARLVFELLCNLTCRNHADESISGLRDEIHMVVRKQLSSSKKIVKHRGIIAAVITAKILATTTVDQSTIEVEDNSMSIEDLPSGAPQDAASLIILANTCTLGSPDSVGLYYDQLASMLITGSYLDNHFMAWLYSMVTNDFQNLFITESVPDPINDIHLSMQHSLNTEEEIDSPIAVKIAELSLKSQRSDNNSVLTLAPMFRLLRLIHYHQHNKNLSTIDALLGCAVIMPNLENMDAYDSHQQRQVADCIFHCINWFREAISAFVTQKSKQLRMKVLERVNDIVHLEKLLEECLENVPDHKLPPSYFDVLSQTTKQLSPNKPVKVARPRKKAKLSETTVNANETLDPALVTQQTKTVASSKQKWKEKIMESNINYREMDTDIILLLRYPLKLHGSFSKFSQLQLPSQSQILQLGIKQFQFLMKDFVAKLERLNKNKSSGFSGIGTVNLTDLISDCIRLLPNIQRNLLCITSGLDELLMQTDGCLDSPEMFTPEANDLKLSFALVMKAYALIFSWSGFQHTKNLNLLRDCLKALSDETPQSQVLMSVKGLITDFTGKLLNHSEHCLQLSAAVSLVQIIQALYALNSNPDVKKRIAILSGKLLTKRWYNSNGNLDAGKNACINVDLLVKAYLSGANLKTVYGLVGTLQQQAAEVKTKEDSLRMLTCIDKSNFYIFYRSLCMTLLEAVRNEVVSLTNNQHLVLWRTTALTLQGLMTIVKAQESRSNLISFLKNSVGILKVFLSSGIPILEIMLRSKTDEVIEIFKIMQTSTRFLHHLCCYSKFTKDTSLVAYVPQFRLLLESLLYRVKAALVANGCSAAFWMGTLRNRDLHGEDILSQSSMQTDETDEIQSDNEELPPDESDDEAPVQDADEGGSDADSSGSEIV